MSASDAPVPVECGEPLVDCTGLDPRVLWDASYRKRGVPGAPERLHLRAEVFRRLRRAAGSLPAGYALLVFDGHRSLETQKALYDGFCRTLRREHPALGEAALLELVDDFAAKPEKNLLRPFPHSTGGAVDLTVAKDGAPLDMGTDFDDASPLARADAEVPEPAKSNRRLLRGVMEGAGFVPYEGEWWHFAYGERLWARANGKTPIYGFIERHPREK
ncbi:MAG TPA: M15 family metallopeptidase [Oscillospiraceae bacterium]|nr:M15 family metallopeptidase [Oscillospiraceae bacterium]